MARPTLAGKSPPHHRREAFGGVDLKSTNDLVYQVSGNNNKFLQRTMKLRGDTVNGLSFIHSVAKNIPMQRDSSFMGKANRSAESDKTKLDKVVQDLRAPVVRISSDSDSTSKGFRQLKNPEHGKKQIFLKDTFNNSNCASSQVSDNGKTLAATYYSNERPWGGMPALYKGESRFASTTYTGTKTKAT